MTGLSQLSDFETSLSCRLATLKFDAPIHGFRTARSFRTVRKNTIKIAEEIPEEKYGYWYPTGGQNWAQYAQMRCGACRRGAEHARTTGRAKLTHRVPPAEIFENYLPLIEGLTRNPEVHAGLHIA
jgi:hypothetical protein